MSDTELLLASRSDAEAFSVLFARHSQTFLAYFYRRTTNRAVSADLLAETFAVAFEKRKRFRSDGGDGTRWLFGIARREVAQFHRKRGVELRAVTRLGITVPEMTDEDVARIESLIDAGAIRTRLNDALDGLSHAERSAVELKIVEELDYPDLAEELGTTVNTARVRVHRGLRRLATQLQAVML